MNATTSARRCGWTFRFRRTVALAATLAALLPSAQAASPSFDCKRAQTPSERAICAQPQLARQDARIAGLYRQRRQALDATGREALARDQRYFLYVRDRVHALTTDDGGVAGLERLQRRRIEFLEAIDTSPRRGPAGRWGNLESQAQVEARDGRWQLVVSGAEPITARWLCEYDGTAIARGDRWQADDAEYRRRVSLRRDGALLALEDGPLGADGDRGATPYCGANGSLDGAYLPLRGAAAR
ncbi:lysozyme inhibitor LprI family protein [Lysobacter firmicutimachus]|uniref:Lysozyme inhibitor LprI family protein n=1 Tax=Lysobacter firmicutimachus TaxID=1792846 RepID=A0AAU8MVH6_9GAMM